MTGAPPPFKMWVHEGARTVATDRAVHDLATHEMTEEYPSIRNIRFRWVEDRPGVWYVFATGDIDE